AIARTGNPTRPQSSRRARLTRSVRTTETSSIEVIGTNTRVPPRSTRMSPGRCPNQLSPPAHTSSPTTTSTTPAATIRSPACCGISVRPRRHTVLLLALLPILELVVDVRHAEAACVEERGGDGRPNAALAVDEERLVARQRVKVFGEADVR